ncbi:hypothetical protein D3C71_778020 [compost metagenome]
MAECRGFRIELKQLSLGVLSGSRSEFALQFLFVLACVITDCRRLDRRDVMAIVLEQRRQQFAVPAVAGSDFNDRLLRPQAKKLQALLRVTVTIARDVFRCTPTAGQYLGVFLGGHGWRGGMAENRSEQSGQRHSQKSRFHGGVLSEVEVDSEASTQAAWADHTLSTVDLTNGSKPMAIIGLLRA